MELGMSGIQQVRFLENSRKKTGMS